MSRSLQKMGNIKGVVLTHAMLYHLGVTYEVEVLIEHGRIWITAPQDRAPRRQSFEEAKASTFDQYDLAMQRLAGAD